MEAPAHRLRDVAVHPGRLRARVPRVATQRPGSDSRAQRRGPRGSGRQVALWVSLVAIVMASSKLHTDGSLVITRTLDVERSQVVEARPSAVLDSPAAQAGKIVWRGPMTGYQAAGDGEIRR
jgi:hypothetical protein